MYAKFEYQKTFNFNKLGIEIKTDELKYTRRTGAAAGVVLAVNSKNPEFASGTFYIRISSDFSTKGKKLEELSSTSYRTTDIEQAKGLNKLTQLIEMVEAHPDDEETLVLKNLISHVKESLLNAHPLKALDENNNPIKKFVTPGYRVNEETFELTEIGSNLNTPKP